MTFPCARALSYFVWWRLDRGAKTTRCGHLAPRDESFVAMAESTRGTAVLTRSVRATMLPCLIVALALSHLGYGYADDAKPAADPNDAQYAPRLTEIEQKIETALAKQVNLHYIDTPLKDIVADLAKQVDLPISLSEEGLNEAGVVAKQAMTLHVGSVSLREGLRVLDILHGLGYVPTTTGLRITSRDMMQERLIVRVYPVDDLLPKRTDYLEEINEASGGFALVSEYDALIDSVISHLAPNSWTDNGGTATINVYQGSLAVSHTLPAHYELRQFLAAHRRAQREHAAIKPGEVAPIVSTRDTSKIREALNKRVSGALETELKWYVRDVTKLTGVPLVLDPKGLEEAEIEKDAFVYATYRDAKVIDILRQVLERRDLAPAFFEEYVILTGRDKACETCGETRIYPVSDLVACEDEILDFDSLIDLITSTVESDSWVDNGGTGAITSLLDPPALIVSVHEDMHTEIEKLLTDLRANGAAKVRDANQKPADRIVQRVYPLYVARRELQVKMALKKSEPEKVQEKKPEAAVPTTPSPGETKVLPQMGGFFVGDNYPVLPQHKLAEPVPSSEDVAKLIEELLPDDSWQEEGVLLRPFHDVLIIRQHPAMHRKVQKLLEAIGAWDGELYPWQPPLGLH